MTDASHTGSNGAATGADPEANRSRQQALEEQNPLIVIVSNRGPYSFKRNERGDLVAKRGAGGLVTALAAVAERHDVLWVAAALSAEDEEWSASHDDQPQMVDGTLLQLIRTDPDRYVQYYNQIANPLLWFIQHQLWDVPRRPNLDDATWEAWREGYVGINRQIAEKVADTVRDSQRPVLIFPQDYHLYLTPKYLRERLGDKVHIQPFVHIPWPGPDAWRMLPTEMRDTLLDSMLAADRIGFQTERDAFNFVQTARFYLQGAHSHGSRVSVEYQGRKVNATSYPISIDVEKVEEMADEPETRLLKAQLINLSADQKRIVRVDRIEPSKNILRGLQAFGSMLEKYPEHLGKVQMIALLVPSRMEVDEYQTYWQDVMMEAGMINAKYSDALWEPVRIIVGNNYPRAIAALQIYDVLLVNPIADGMNLVAKEGSLVNQKDGVLILSEHAGAFYELAEHAMVVSPFDIHGTTEAMHAALKMPEEERRRRAAALRNQVRQNGVRQWFYTQLDDALRDLNSHSKNADTSSMPAASTSDDASTMAGVSSASTPSASE